MARPRVDVTLLSSGHDVADARLHRHCAAFRRAGLSVEVIAKGRAEDAPVDTEFRSVHPSGFRELARDRLQPGEGDQHDKRSPLPDVSDNNREES